MMPRRADEKGLEELLLEIFGGNTYYSKAREIKGEISYHPVESPLTEETLTEHLSGVTTLGAYQLIKGADVVRWLGWDVDSKDLKTARDIVLKLTKHIATIPYAVEFSGRKGYHILVFLRNPMPAENAKKFTEWVREKEGLAASGDTHVECFPKQGKLSNSTPMGNLIKIPLGLHPKTHDKSRFVDILNGWENGPELDPWEILRYRVFPEAVMDLMDTGPELAQQLVDLISEYWKDGRRHDLSLYLCGYLANEGWGLEQTKDIMRDIMFKTGDTEDFNRIQTVETTFQRMKEGKSIRGRQGLGEILPVTAMQRLTEMVAQMKAPDTVAQIDDIRYLKGKPKLEAARLAAHTIWSTLNDNGCRMVQTDQNIAYWYNSEFHTLTEEGTEKWRTMLNKDFGLNPVDPFSKLVYAELRFRTVREAMIVPIRNRTFWDEDAGNLYINLGGQEVYIINGSGNINTGYNGECGIMFVTNESGKYVVPDFEADQIDAWSFLVNDISFGISADAPANPDEQRELLKAWILAFFFQEIFPTKPILSIIGMSGSGKTTALRRILRVLEDPESDVLGVPTDKQDSFRASIGAHRLLTIDNLEKSGAFWMIDILNKLSTGNRIELRELYRTNTKFTIIPQCFVALTAVNVPFSEETLFSRLLILETDRLQDPLPEHLIQRRIRENGPAIWADLIRKLDMIVSTLRRVRNVRPPTKSRLVDFTVFCERIRSCKVVNGETLSLGLLTIVDSQMRQLKESSQAIKLLEEWISMKPQEACEWRTFAQMYELLYHMALSRKQNFNWKNAASLYRHFIALEDRLRKDFQAEMVVEYSASINKNVAKIRFNTMIN